jgi:hypothetical protein
MIHNELKDGFSTQVGIFQIFNRNPSIQDGKYLQLAREVSTANRVFGFSVLY